MKSIAGKEKKLTGPVSLPQKKKLLNKLTQDENKRGLRKYRIKNQYQERKSNRLDQQVFQKRTLKQINIR